MVARNDGDCRDCLSREASAQGGLSRSEARGLRSLLVARNGWKFRDRHPRRWRGRDDTGKFLRSRTRTLT